MEMKLSFSEMRSSLSDTILRSPSTPLSIMSVEKPEETTAADAVVEAKELDAEGVISVKSSQDILSNEATKTSAWECVRQTCRDMARTKTMENAVLLMILGNCITLVMFDSEDRNCLNPACKKLKTFEILFSGMALIECIIRITGDGFRFYWRDNWNRMDFIIVCCGIIDFFPGIESGALSALRTTRVLRPLRVVNRFPSLRMLVRLLLDTIPLLGSVLVLCMFLFSAFGIMGVQLWKGVLRGGCYNDAGDLYKPPDNKYYVCSQGGGGMKSCPPPVIPGYIHNAELYTTCNQTDEPNFMDGAISFDNIFVAFIAVFQVITLEDWSELMYALQDGYSYWVWPFFVLLILLGSWFATNLALVVIATQFKVTKKREAQLMIQEAENTGKLPPKSMWLECIRVIGSLFCCWDNPCMHNGQDDNAKEKPARAQFTAEMTDEERQDLKMIQDVFDLLDQDQDGSISVEELRDALQVLDSHLPKSELKALAESIDVDGDGLIDFEEFRVLMGYDATGTGIKATGAGLDAHDIENGVGVSTIPKLSKFRAFVQRIVSHKWFTGAVVICIAVNTLSMAFEHHGQPDELTSFIEVTNAIFAFVFLIEVILRIISVGAKVYLLNGFNVCDGIIVILGVVEVFANSGNLTALRSFRLLRLFKLARYLPTMQKQLTVMLKSLDSVMTFLLLLSLFIFMFAIMGMHLFGGKLLDPANMSYTGTITRGSFDDFPKSVISVFQVLTTEEWNIMMYHAMHSTAFSASLYFITLIIFGTYILVNLFVAIMVEGFATDPEAIERFKAAVERARAMFNIPDSNDEETMTLEDAHETEMADGQNPLDQSQQSVQSSDDCCLLSACCFSARDNKVGVVVDDSDLLVAEEDGDVDSEGIAVPPNKDGANNDDEEVQEHAEAEAEEDDEAHTLVEGDGRETNLAASSAQTVQAQSFKCRKPKKKSWSKAVLNSRACHWIIVIFLTFDAVLLCIERPAIAEDSNERLFLEIADFVCESIFTAEALLKIATVGFVRGPDAYMKSVWNIFDFTLLLSSWPRLIIEIAKFHTPAADAASRAFRIYRTVRPFRIIPRVPPVKQTMHMLYVSVRPVGNLLLVGSVFYIIFAILGVQMFKGKLYLCDTDVVDTRLPTVCEAVNGMYNTSAGVCDIAAYSVLDKTDCSLGGGLWQRRQYNFDNVVEAVLTLFVVSSRDGWIEIMQSGMDVVGVDMQPQEDSNSLQAVFFFISFLLIVGYFVISMFVGVIVENFQLSMPPVEVQDFDDDDCEDDGRADNEETEVFYDEDGLPIAYLPYDEPPKYRIQRWACSIVNHKYFEHVMAAAIFLNVLIMGCEHLNQSDAVSAFLEASNYTFTAIYVLEMIIKIVADGPTVYFSGSWNRFDAFVAITSLIGVSLTGDGALSNSSSLQAVRIMRVARILKLMKVATGLSSLLTTVWSSMPQVMCMGLILLILFISASALGIELFGKIGFNSTSPSTGISSHANFENAALSGLTLFRIATGDNWVGIMRDTLASGLPRAPVVVYYVFFVVTAQFVLLNVVVAVLMKNLTAALQWVDIDTGELMDGESESPTPTISDDALAIAPSTSKKFKVRPAITVDGDNKVDDDPENNDDNKSDKSDKKDANNGDANDENKAGAHIAIAEVATEDNEETNRASTPPTLPVRHASLQVVDFNHERLSAVSKGDANSNFLNPPERLLENLQERTARLSMRCRIAPNLGGSEPVIEGESRNKRALKASLHLVMAMVKMSGQTDISKPKDGSRAVRLSIRKHVYSGQGRQSMMRSSVNSRSSVRTLTRPSVNSRASFRTSVRPSINSARPSINSRMSFRGSVGTRPSIKSHHRHSTNNSNRGSLRTFATRGPPTLIGENEAEIIVTPPSLN